MVFNLRKALNEYKPKCEQERESLFKIQNFLSSSDNCFDRSNLAGHITAGALVIDGNGEVLMNHHKILDKWIIFGGHSDGEEDSLNVARREVMEESGISDIEVVGGGYLM